MINKFDSGEAKNNLSSHSGNLVGDLLDLEVGEYNPAENNVTTNSDVNSFDNFLIPTSSEFNNSLNPNLQNNYSDASSDLISLPLSNTDPFSLVSLKL